MSFLSSEVRRPTVAGSFYPAAADELADLVDRLLMAAKPALLAPKALVVPHAGYAYSGPVAATAYASLMPARGRVRRVVLLGPAHRVPVRGFAVPSLRAFETPLGSVSMERGTLARLAAWPDVEVNDAAHAPEHSLETQLPFIQRSLGDVSLVPVLVGPAEPERVAELLADLWGGAETAILVSSDLSHYLDAQAAAKSDGAAAASIEALRPDLLGEQQACGRHALRGLMVEARRRGLRATCLDLRTSADTGHTPERTVGYGSFAFEEADKALLPSRERQQLLEAAGKSLGSWLRSGREPEVKLASFSRPLRAIRPTFVTLKRAGRLRGCIGSLQPQAPLILDVVRNAKKAGFNDPRFEPLKAGELSGLTLSVTLLSTRAPLLQPGVGETEIIEALEPGRDGVVLTEGRKSALFLPQVWEDLPEPAQFLAALKRKAGLAADHWSGEMRVERFWGESFGCRIES